MYSVIVKIVRGSHLFLIATMLGSLPAVIPQVAHAQTTHIAGAASRTRNAPAKSEATRQLRAGAQERLNIGLFFMLNGNSRVADGVSIIYNNNYSAEVDGDDAEQIANFDEDLAIRRGGKSLSIEARPLVDDKDTIFLNIVRMKQQGYELRFTPTDFNAPDLQAYLQDAFTNTQTAISLSANTIYPFTVTSTAASFSATRFRVVYFMPDYESTGNVSTSSPSNWQYYNGIAWVNATAPPTFNSSVLVKAGHTITISDNFTVGTGKTLLLQTGSAMIIQPNKIFSVNGSADFNNQPVTVQSTPAGTGSIGQIAAPTDTRLLNATAVTVERYIAAQNSRAYRSLATSVNTTAASAKPYLQNNWQEGVNNTDKAINLDAPAGSGVGTHITGSTTGANGFDATQSGAASLFTYNGTGYVAINNTDNTLLNAKTGYLLFVRGDRSSISHLNGQLTSANTILRTTGSLVTGNVPYTLNGLNKFTLVTNPYAAPVDWSSVYADTDNTGIQSFYTYVDPRIGDRGGYVTVTQNGMVNPVDPNITASVHIQSGQSFFVKSSAEMPAFTLKETHKSAVNNVNVFRNGAQEKMSIGLYYQRDGVARIADGVNVLFNNSYSPGVDENDAEQMANFDEDIAIVRQGKLLAIEGRPLVGHADTIFLQFTNGKQKEYTLVFNPAHFNAPGLQAYLHDNFLDTETEISLNAQSSIPFTITNNIASSATDRFRVVFRTASVLPINFTLVKAFEKGTGIQVDWNLGNEAGIQQYEIEKAIDGRMFAKAGTQAVRNIANAAGSYTWLDATPNSGDNFYRIKAVAQNGTFKYSSVVKLKTGNGAGSISIYPNPVTDHAVNLQFVHQPAGKYAIRMTNSLGQQVYQREYVHVGGSANQSLLLPASLSKGVYRLQVTHGSKQTTQEVVIR